MADRAGTAPETLREVFDPDRPADAEGQLSVPLDPGWHPRLAASDRYDLEGRALARRAYAPWLVFLGHRDPVDPDSYLRGLDGRRDLSGQLDRLCRLADRLCLDLVVEARAIATCAPSWVIRFEVPGSAVPEQPHGSHPDLPTAVARTTVADAWHDFAERGRTAPAHFVDPPLPDPDSTPFEPVDVDQLERRILRDCADAPGAQAVWRDGRWRHTRLRAEPETERLTELETGQVARWHRTTLARNWEPPAPSWLGPPIPHTRCPGCRGSGTREWLLPCHTCRGGRRIHHGAVLTVTDLADRVVHLNWRPEAAPVRVVGSEPAGLPVVQLPERYRVGTWAATFGVRPEELHDPGTGRALDQDLLDGVVTLSDPDGDPVEAYLAAVARGRPAARVVVSAAGRDVPPLPRLARLVCGLGLVLQVTVADHRHDAGAIPGSPTGCAGR
ncbi:hypothetical protein ACQEVC_05940 [Plantactinospora sp. CA-294935]|uniref:hypothetical protein n=1 Tax=Plantactinospora sp. CA-294935 TaxID=3240012 RepID=UPI003D940D15